MGLRRISALTMLLGWLVLPACAQVAPAPDAPPAEGIQQQNSAPASQASSSAPAPRFEISANLVSLYFTVRGPHAKLIPNLTKADCAVYEDDAPQVLKNFAVTRNQPLTIGILLDTSLSQQRVLPTEQQAAVAFLRRVLKPRDEAFLISFDVDATMLSDLTGSASNLARAIDGARVNSNSGNFANGTLPSIGRPKGTVLYDAIFLAANNKLRPETGRKALILLTDGEDEGSQQGLKSATEAAQRADTVVYVLLIQDSGILGMSDDLGAGPMGKLTRATGGEVFKIGNNGRKMQAAFEQIESELRSQYQASYTPANKEKDGAYRRIRVECRENRQGLHVQVRQGYYAEPGGK